MRIKIARKATDKVIDLGKDLILYHGDCIKLMEKIPDNFFSLILTSPPYNLGKEYERKVDLAEYEKWHEIVITECHRILKKEGSICWQVGNYVDKGEIYPLDVRLYPIFKRLGMTLRNRVVWFFRHGLHAKKRFSGRYETLLWFTKSNDYTFNLEDIRVPQLYPRKKFYKGPKKGEISAHPKGKNPSDVWEDIQSDVWDISNVHNGMPEKTVHPCQFPEALAERVVKALTNKGEWVFDPFLGSGTTAVVALRLSRKVIGAELKKEYVNIAWRRIKQSLKAGKRD